MIWYFMQIVFTAWIAKSCFLRKIRKNYLNMSFAKNFAQTAALVVFIQ